MGAAATSRVGTKRRPGRKVAVTAELEQRHKRGGSDGASGACNAVKEGPSSHLRRPEARRGGVQFAKRGAALADGPQGGAECLGKRRRGLVAA